MVARHGSFLLPTLLLAAALAGCPVKTTGKSGLAAGSAERMAADVATSNLEIVKSTYEGAYKRTGKYFEAQVAHL